MLKSWSLYQVQPRPTAQSLHLVSTIPRLDAGPKNLYAALQPVNFGGYARVESKEH